jgi:EAL domain-containing protein (putative c-di-GMP-specific phosphodiesterase class I)
MEPAFDVQLDLRQDPPAVGPENRTGGLLGMACPPTARWLLSGRANPEASLLEVLVSDQATTVGRHPDNDLCLANPTVSGYHAELIPAQDGLTVIDLQSTNGTFVDGSGVKDRVVLHGGETLQFGTAVFHVRRRDQALAGVTVSVDVASNAQTYLKFQRLLDDPALVPFFQPVRELPSKRLVGFEVLARSHVEGLETPTDMFRVAATLNCEAELSELAREQGVYHGSRLGYPLFLNTHPSELDTLGLLRSLEQLRQSYPDVPLHVEVHEAALASTGSLRQLRESLRALDIGLAYDDFGAGQARLRELVDVPPDFVKFDMCLVRGLDTASAEHRQLVRSLVEVARELGVTTLAEGVETAEEAKACESLGFELAQGYFFGRPAPVGSHTTA